MGKSTFVKCALDLKQTPLVRSSIKKMSMDGAIYVVRLLEIAIHKITLDDRGRIVWPKCLGEQALPPIDGVLCLFDSTDLRSVSQYPQVLGKTRPLPRCRSRSRLLVSFFFLSFFFPPFPSLRRSSCLYSARRVISAAGTTAERTES